MQSASEIRMSLKEGMTQDYFDAYQCSLGGTIDGNVYRLEDGVNSIDLIYYELVPGMELLIGEASFTQTLVADRHPCEDDEIIHFNLVLDGRVVHSLEDGDRNLDSDGYNRVFIYNGQFRMEVRVPADVPYRSVAFKVTKEAFSKIMPESLDVFDVLFPNHSAAAYHTYLPKELESLVNDIFLLKKQIAGRVPLTIARGLEIFALFIGSIREMIEKDELHGLHQDDYDRLMDIKAKLISDFSQKVVVEDIAHEFGISISKLKRDFKVVFGTSVYQYFLQAKMQEAYNLLKSGNVSVSEVAYDMGYDNPSKFTQMFKKAIGINPSEVLKV